MEISVRGQHQWDHGRGFCAHPETAHWRPVGTTLTNYVGSGNKQAFNTWAGQDRGATVLGFSNNVALGRLILDTSGGNSVFNFGAVPRPDQRALCGLSGIAQHRHQSG